MKYDDAEFYFLNYETEELDNEAAATHIGMFITWMVMHELMSNDMRQHDGEAVAQLRLRSMTPGQFAIDRLDCKLFDDNLSEFGNAFASTYYATDFLRDYMETFGVDDSTPERFCSVPDTWENFDKLAPAIDVRFERFKRSRRL